jgi:hypothetical protein
MTERTIIFSSQNRSKINDPVYNFSIKLPRYLLKDATTIEVNECSFGHTEYIINSLNYKFYFTDSLGASHILELTQRSYGSGNSQTQIVNDLASELQQEMNSATTDGRTYIVSYNSQLVCFEFSFNGISSESFSFNFLDTMDSCCEIFGFEKTNYTSTDEYKLFAPFAPKYHPDYYKIISNLVSETSWDFNNNSPENLLATVTLDLGEKSLVVGKTDNKHNISNNQLQYATFKIIDDNSRLAKIRSHIYIKCKINYTNQNNKYL